MKKLSAIAALLALGMWLSSCGSKTIADQPITADSSSNWEATLTGGLGEASKLNFLTNFNVGSGGGQLDITAFSFFNNDPNACFIKVSGATGSTILTTNAANQVTGSMLITVTSSSPAGSTLTLSTTAGPGLPGGELSGTSNGGNLTNGVVTGNWTLTGGTGCTGQGTFLMCQGAATCTQID